MIERHKRTTNNQRCDPSQIRSFLCFHCGDQFPTNAHYQKHLLQEHQTMALCYQIYHAEMQQEKQEKRNAEKKIHRSSRDSSSVRKEAEKTTKSAPSTTIPAKNVAVTPLPVVVEKVEEKPKVVCVAGPSMASAVIEPPPVDPAELEKQRKEDERRERRRLQDRIRRAKRTQERKERAERERSRSVQMSSPPPFAPSATSRQKQETGKQKADVVARPKSDAPKPKVVVPKAETTVPEVKSEETRAQSIIDDDVTRSSIDSSMDSPEGSSPPESGSRPPPTTIPFIDLEPTAKRQKVDVPVFVLYPTEMRCQFCEIEQKSVCRFSSAPDAIDHFVVSHGVSIVEMNVHTFQDEVLLGTRASKAGDVCRACGVSFSYNTEYFHHLIMEHTKQVVTTLHCKRPAINRFRVDISVQYRKNAAVTVVIEGGRKDSSS